MHLDFNIRVSATRSTGSDIILIQSRGYARPAEAWRLHRLAIDMTPAEAGSEFRSLALAISPKNRSRFRLRLRLRRDKRQHIDKLAFITFLGEWASARIIKSDAAPKIVTNDIKA